ncbi:MAG: hypothetical protein N2645_13495 [Clostridia bacterium]|nr:hypothetical protein [Clostridia bacterium]
MLYRRMNQKPRKFLPPSDIDPISIPIKEIEKIPLPTEDENTHLNQYEKNNRFGKKSNSILEVLKNRIHVEEIILIGLIFLILDERIEDEFLLIILVYLLLN